MDKSIIVEFENAQNEIATLEIEFDEHTTEDDIVEATENESYEIVKLNGFDGLVADKDLDLEHLNYYCKWEDLYSQEAVQAAIDIFGRFYFASSFDSGNYQGEHDSEEDFAIHLVNDLGMLKDAGDLAKYFDYEEFARDLFMMDYVMSNGHVFRNS